MDVLANLSVEDARRLNVVDSSPVGHGVTNVAHGVTFNYVYIEVQDRYISGEVFVLPKDSLNATIVLRADGTRLLTWDLGNAKPAAQPSLRPTFVAKFASTEPFNDVPGAIDKQFTPVSQGVTINQSKK